ncbi:MAG: CHAD domain-containing protein [Planctomycetes bacterium]|nr:CHAD domain-containing protein [Planctomycetota bacterium]
MHRVLDVHAKAGDLRAGPVHEVRVALRSCRAIAAGMRELDGDKGWRRMNKQARGLFQALGELRDGQALAEVLSKLAPRNDSTRVALQKALDESEAEHRKEAGRALKKFDRKRWKKLTRRLPGRTVRLELDSPVFQHMALQRLGEVRDLHMRALRANTRPTFHELRIAVKRLRYVVDNFLPSIHAAWGKRLRQVQSLLGDLHDVDNLERMLGQPELHIGAQLRRKWERRMDQRGRKMMQEYRELSEGSEPLWPAIRAQLPDGDALRTCVRAKLTAWAEFRDPDPAHARHVSKLALDLFDGLAKAGLNSPFGELGARELLEAAALLHNVGRSGGKKGSQKRAWREIRDLQPPIGWIDSDVQTVALLARYHRGALPSARQKTFAQLPVAARERLVKLAGVLRLAVAFDATEDGRVSRLWVDVGPEAIIINAKGYLRQDKNSRELAQQKALIESALNRLILVRPGAPAHVTIAHAAAARADDFNEEE